MGIFLVAVGGGLGATLRYAVIYLLDKKQKPFFYATFIVNIIGSFAMGITLHYSIDYLQWTLFFATGVLGGFTTFSTFAYDLVRLYEKRDIRSLIIYSIFTLFLSMLAVSFGYYLIA